MLSRGSVLAQPQPAPRSLADTLTGTVRSDYDAARLLFADGDFAGALVKFERAYQQQPDERLLWNMAACEKSLRRYARALELLERYRSEGEARMSAAHRAEVLAVIDSLQSLVTRVSLVVNEPDAAVYVDERRVGRSPFARSIHVDAGSRRIRASKPGFVEQITTREFAGGEAVSLVLTLVPEPRDARITVVAAGSTISVDGNLVGQDRWEGSLAEGTHTLRVSAPDMVASTQEFVVEAGQPRTLYVQLTRNESGGVPAWLWVGAGIVVTGGLAAGAYFLLREPTSPDNTIGTLPPGVVQTLKWTH